jgi:hypothetical protein
MNMKKRERERERVNPLFPEASLPSLPKLPRLSLSLYEKEGSSVVFPKYPKQKSSAFLGIWRGIYYYKTASY